MSHIYTYPVPPCREKCIKQKNNDLALFKMATICGYPGASKKCLPFIHASFPASETLPTAKCYSFCHKRDQNLTSSMSNKSADECKAVVCYQEKELFDLPEIHPSSPDRKPSRYDNAYVKKNKVCFKLKGINPKNIYCANRSRPNVSATYRHSLECLRINPQRSSSLLQLSFSDPWNMAVESIAKATLQGASSARDRELEGEDFREASPITMAMMKKYEEERRHVTSGLKGHKVRNGRPLGHVVKNTQILERGKSLPVTSSRSDVTKES